jgi:hypothetical protein
MGGAVVAAIYLQEQEGEEDRRDSEPRSQQLPA